MSSLPPTPTPSCTAMERGPSHPHCRTSTSTTYSRAHSSTRSPTNVSQPFSPLPSVRCPPPPPAPTPNALAAGYGDGSIRLFSLVTFTCTLTLHGHSVCHLLLCCSTAAAPSSSPAPSMRTSICWDVVAERGLVRLRGHRDAVTSLVTARPSAPRPSPPRHRQQRWHPQGVGPPLSALHADTGH